MTFSSSTKPASSGECTQRISVTLGREGVGTRSLAEKGFGFIEPRDGSKGVFVHISAVERADMRTLMEGRRLRHRDRAGQAGGVQSSKSIGQWLTRGHRPKLVANNRITLD